MNIEAHTSINHFWAVGINYKKSDAAIRGQFAISPDQYANLLTIAGQNGMRELFVLSTCNRTEIYGMAESASQLLDLITSQCGTHDRLNELVYAKQGTE